jgi:hypothetical protein
MATKYTKWPQNIPNGHKIYQIALQYQYHCKTLQNLPKLGFLVWKYAIWQPRSDQLFFFAVSESKFSITTMHSYSYPARKCLLTFTRSIHSWMLSKKLINRFIPINWHVCQIIVSLIPNHKTIFFSTLSRLRQGTLSQSCVHFFHTLRD